MTVFKSLMAFLIFHISVCGNVMGADIQGDKYDGRIVIRGEIKSGDAERLVEKILAGRIVGKDGQSTSMYPLSIINLNSPGGDVVESQKIAALVKAAYLTVWVGDGRKSKPAVCASSCFLIFLSGMQRYAIGADVGDRWNWTRVNQGIVGIHRPYFSTVDGGPASQAKQENMMQSMRSTLRGEGLSQRLIDEMMEHPSNQIYWLSQKDLSSIGQYPPGIEEELIAKCKYKRDLDIADLANQTQVDRLNDCISKQLMSKYRPVTEAVLERMRTGWRPWK